MRLSNSNLESKADIGSAKEVFIDLITDLEKNESNIRKSITNEQNLLFSDALAIGKVLQGNINRFDNEGFKRHASKFKEILSHALFEEDYDFLKLRNQIKRNQEALVKDVAVRGLPTDTEYVMPYADNPTNQGGKTASPISPILIAERVMRDLTNRFYVSAQDAYDGYTQKHGLWIFASARQKCLLAEILRYNGFVINDEAWRKDSDADFKEYKNIHKEDGKGEPDPNYKYIKNTLPNKNESKIVDAADHTNTYCNKCGKTTRFEKGVCQSCGTAKTTPVVKPKRASIISMIRRAQMDQARPNVLQIVVKNLTDKFNSFKQPITPIDVRENINNVIDQTYPDQNENTEEKQFMLGGEGENQDVNSVILQQILQTLKEQNIPVIGNSTNTQSGYRANPEMPLQQSSFEGASKIGQVVDKDALIEERINDFYKEAKENK